ncbi:Flp pilus assembly protein CpaB [Thiohalobacter sp.]|uniref:Flp pilus assembly protein CpaB n=1 Tax=Thiohalobacter sp. TaxID=2025948 RepID=UPI00261A1F3B|nr:Flp pilus assembly protein CpaB [Thiohalobacter sp.]
MDKKNLKLLLIALGLGALAALLSFLYLKAREAELRAQLTPHEEMVEVVVASRDLVKGDKLNASNLAVRSVPAKYVDDNAVRPSQFEEIDGQVLNQNLASGRPLMRSYVAREFPLDFSDTIPLKRRAMTIQVDEVNSVSGFVRPGDRIDLFALLPPGAVDEKDDSHQVMPLLENVEVLATGRDAARDYEEKVRLLRGGVAAQPDDSYTTLTLNVTPREAAVLATAREKGDLLAVLRNRKDDSGSGFTRVTPADLRSNAERLAQAAAVRASTEQLGEVRRDADGNIITADGRKIAGDKLVVAEDGTLMTRDGVVLSGRGLQVNDKGQLITPDGKVVDPDRVRVAADGSLITADGTVVAGAPGTRTSGVTVNPDGTVTTADGRVLTGVELNKDGKIVLPDGTVVDPRDVVVRADGTVLTRDGKVLAGVGTTQAAGTLTRNADGSVTTADGTVLAGARLDKDGKLVLADGTVVDPKDVVIHPDGTVTTRDGKVLKGIQAGEAAGSLRADADGTIRTASGAIIEGATLREDGKLVLPDGTVVDPKDVIVHPDGSVTTRDGKVLKGLTARNVRRAGVAPKITATTPLYEVDYIVGGDSDNGVANVRKIPVMP